MVIRNVALKDEPSQMDIDCSIVEFEKTTLKNCVFSGYANTSKDLVKGLIVIHHKDRLIASNRNEAKSYVVRIVVDALHHYDSEGVSDIME